MVRHAATSCTWQTLSSLCQPPQLCVREASATLSRQRLISEASWVPQLCVTLSSLPSTHQALRSSTLSPLLSSGPLVHTGGPATRGRRLHPPPVPVPLMTLRRKHKRWRMTKKRKRKKRTVRRGPTSINFWTSVHTMTSLTFDFLWFSKLCFCVTFKKSCYEFVWFPYVPRELVFLWGVNFWLLCCKIIYWFQESWFHRQWIQMCQMCQEPQFAFLLINCWNFNPEWFEFSFYYDVSQNQLPKDSLLNTGTHKPPLTYTPAYIYSFFRMSWRVKCVSGECFLKWWLPEWRPVLLTFRHPCIYRPWQKLT